MDEADQASQIEAAEREAGITCARRKAMANGGTATCLDCGGDIEPGRRAAVPGARRCHACQTLKERMTP